MTVGPRSGARKVAGLRVDYNGEEHVVDVKALNPVTPPESYADEGYKSAKEWSAQYYEPHDRVYKVSLPDGNELTFSAYLIRQIIVHHQRGAYK